MFCMWRDYDMVLWRRGGGAWHYDLFITAASNVNCWADLSNHVTILLSGDTENF